MVKLPARHDDQPNGRGVPRRAVAAVAGGLLIAGLAAVLGPASAATAGNLHTFRGVQPNRKSQTVANQLNEQPQLGTSSAAPHHLHLVAETGPAESGVVVHFYTASASGHIVNYIGHATTNSAGYAHLTLTRAASGKTYIVTSRVVTATQYNEVYSNPVRQRVR